MKRLCDKTIEEQIVMHKRLQVLTLSCIFAMIAIIGYDFVTGHAVSVSYTSLCCMVCVMCTNIKKRKELEAAEQRSLS